MSIASAIRNHAQIGKPIHVLVAKLKAESNMPFLDSYTFLSDTRLGTVEPSSEVFSNTTFPSSAPSPVSTASTR